MMEIPSEKMVVQLSYLKSSRPGFNIAAAILVCFVLLSINAFFFIDATTSHHVRADLWRHLDEIVIPFLDGSGGLKALWTNHHPSPLLHLLQIANVKYLGFRLDYDAFLGFLFQMLTTLLIVGSILSRTTGMAQRNGIVLCLSAILVITIELGFNTLDQYTWPLVATVQYLYFFGIVVFLLVDLCIRRPARGNYLAVGAGSLVLIFANASYGTIFLLSMTAVLGLVFVLERRAVYLRTALVLFSVWSIYIAVLMVIVPTSPYRPSLSMLDISLYYLGHPVTVATQFSLAICAGLVDIVSLKNIVPGSEQYLIAIAWLLMLVALLVFFVYLKRKVYRLSVVPLALMVVSVVFAGPALINRFIWIAGDDWGLTQSRYATTFKLVVIGVIWAMLLIGETSPFAAKSSYKRSARAVVLSVIGLLLIVQVFQFYNGWRMAPSMDARNQTEALAIFHASKPDENTIRLPFRVSGYGGVRGSLTYLEQNHLNVFAENFPGSPMVKQQVQARRLFDASDSTVAIIEGEVAPISVASDDGEIRVILSAGSTGIAISSLSDDDIFLRVKVKSSKHIDGGISVASRSTHREIQAVDLLPGKQNLYFLLGAKETVDIAILKPATVMALELRR